MASLTVKLLAAMGIGIALFAISLLVIHVSLRTIVILFGIGGTLVVIYFYIDWHERRPTYLKDMCKCNVCDHKHEDTCVDERCGCCTLEKDGRYEHGVSTLT